jgi:hypothetical protein
MRFITRILLSSFLAATFAYAQTIPPQTFSHIIIVIQENRTPDNIFGSTPKRGTNCTGEDPFETGVDIENGGYVCTSVSNGECLAQQLICNISQPMNNGPIFDPGHFYEDWVKDYLDGGMNGFCHGFNPPTYCPTYSYVQKSDVQPYFDIATGYGFANYMFQTNEGPSFPAHQFLFTGTSAPVAPTKNYYLDFVADNAPKPNGFADSGCPYDGNYGWPTWVLPDGLIKQPPPLLTECYTHDSLVTNALGDKKVSWRYYTPTLGIIWDAPEGIPEVCYGQNKDVGGKCAGGEFTNNVKLPDEGPYDGAPILDDISNCNLQKISWVIPDQAWSDHPQFDGSRTPPFGPSWVGNIINAVGNSWANSNGKCDYWGYPAHQGTNPEPPPSWSSGTTGAASSITFPRLWRCNRITNRDTPSATQIASGDAATFTASGCLCWWCPNTPRQAMSPGPSRARVSCPSTNTISAASSGSPNIILGCPKSPRRITRTPTR